ncbi:vlp protein (plasmid) [Borrelia duttonii Ly]|uniref:Variable large protein n=1 Tax=Borrelia duttonii (strain Ly) TaxID=412419 RepID=B5RNN0_BORDL|nr:vlp protein [Borrelia duttonii Ly]
MGGVKGEGAAGGDGRGVGSLSELIATSRQVFLDAFVSFGELLKGTFGITSDATKEEVGERLGKIGEAVQVAKRKLESIKEDSNYNLIKTRVDSIMTKVIDTLEKIVNGANKIKESTISAADKIASATADNNDAVQADKISVKGLVEGISMLCEAAKGVGTEPKGNVNRVITDSKEVGNLFGETANVTDAKALSGANKALNEVSGADILLAIEAAKDGTSKDAGDINAATNAFDMAIANKNHGNLSNINTNASVISAGLALKAMAKNGKLATLATHAPKEGINAVLYRSVNKTVNEIVSIIRRTVDKCLKDVDDCLKENFSSEVSSS